MLKNNILKLNLLVMSGVKLIQIVNKIMTTQVLILLVLKQASRLRKLFLCELHHISFMEISINSSSSKQM